jgi:Holliday junction DNA helicase RuvA
VEARAANDAVLALIALGYRQVDAAKSVREAALKNKEAGTEELVRLALKGLV